MKIFPAIPIVAFLLPLASLGSSNSPPLYRPSSRPSDPYYPRPRHPSQQQQPKQDYYPPLAQHPQPNLACCRSSFPGEMPIAILHCVSQPRLG